ncbi:MAG TPA: nuclear transport factor 2 family protein [Candidatus Synoicihabitans sp.]|nr:nuclear transport factor 2 family protein [Candidatus Synoicihabitans sp.]
MTTTTNQTEGPQWIGAFTPEDRAQIEALRLGQAAAIETGDADAYARLCADDIHLMLPGRDIVAGREQLHQFQAALFRETKYDGMRKFPVRVERSGDLAVEIGRQELAAKTGTFAGKQKYTHVMRRTSDGWRFAVLMSNNSVAS